MTRAESLRLKAQALMAEARHVDLREKRRERKERTHGLILLGTLVANDETLLEIVRTQFGQFRERDEALLSRLYPSPSSPSSLAATISPVTI